MCQILVRFVSLLLGGAHAQMYVCMPLYFYEQSWMRNHLLQKLDTILQSFIFFAAYFWTQIFQKFYLLGFSCLGLLKVFTLLGQQQFVVERSAFYQFLSQTKFKVILIFPQLLIPHILYLLLLLPLSRKVLKIMIFSFP